MTTIILTITILTIIIMTIIIICMLFYNKLIELFSKQLHQIPKTQLRLMVLLQKLMTVFYDFYYKVQSVSDLK